MNVENEDDIQNEHYYRSLMEQYVLKEHRSNLEYNFLVNIPRKVEISDRLKHKPLVKSSSRKNSWPLILKGELDVNKFIFSVCP